MCGGPPSRCPLGCRAGPELSRPPGFAGEVGTAAPPEVPGKMGWARPARGPGAEGKRRWLPGAAPPAAPTVSPSPMQAAFGPGRTLKVPVKNKSRLCLFRMGSENAHVQAVTGAWWACPHAPLPRMGDSGAPSQAALLWGAGAEWLQPCWLRSGHRAAAQTPQLELGEPLVAPHGGLRGVWFSVFFIDRLET